MMISKNKVFCVVLLFSFVLLPEVNAADEGTAEGQNPSGVLKIGAATRVINPRLGSWVQGAGMPRKATKIRDNLEANGLYLSGGGTSLLMISCDLIGLELPHATMIREAMSEATDVPARNILITCTHTHGGPSLVKSNYLMPVDGDYIEHLKHWLVEVAEEAVQSAQVGKVGWGKGVAKIGYNRRVCWANGSHSMYGDAKRKDFSGLEGPDDPQHLAMFFADQKGDLIAVLHHNTCHPAHFYAAGIITSDYPGDARTILRKEMGEIPVLFFSGALGDIASIDILHRKSEPVEEKMARISGKIAGETLRLYKEVQYHDQPVISHRYEDLQVKVRLPDPTKLVAYRKTLEKIDAGENIRGMTMIMAHGADLLQKKYGENPVDTVPVHTIRIGDVALATQPCEYYCQFGLEIKRRSPAPITATIGLADGYVGYCPTIYGVLGGGYSAEAIYWARLEPNAGYMIVESAGKMLNSLWRDDTTK